MPVAIASSPLATRIDRPKGTAAGMLFALSLVASVVAVACQPPDESQASEDPIHEGAADGGSATLPAPSNGSSSSSGGDASAASSGDAGAPDAPCTVSFTKTVLAAIDKAGCASIRCHGTRFGADPRLAPDDADLTYNALLNHKIGGKAYVNPKTRDPNESAMHCHLKGECGAKMPPGGGTIPKELVTAADAWLACGAPKN